MMESQRKSELIRSPAGPWPAGRSRWYRGGNGRDFGFHKGGDLNRQGAWLLFALFLIGWLLAFLYLGLVSYTMVQARRVQDLRETLLHIQAVNARLEQQIGAQQRDLLEWATRMGFVPVSQVEVVGP